MATNGTGGFAAAHCARALAAALIALGCCTPAWSGTITSSAALDFSLTFKAAGIGPTHSEAATAREAKPDGAAVTIKNVPGNWTFAAKDDLYVYALTGLLSTVELIGDEPTHGGAWGTESWAAFLRLTNVSGAPMTLSVTAAWKPKLSVAATGFSPDAYDVLRPFAVGRYDIEIYLLKDKNDPVGDTPPGWDGNKGHAAVLGDPLYTTAGSDAFSVPLADAGDDAVKLLWIRVKTTAVAEIPEPSSLPLALLGLLALASVRMPGPSRAGSGA